MKKILIILGALLVLAGSAWWLLKKQVLRAPGFKPAAEKRRNPVDLSPEVIAKLQQLVHEGSDGLYHLHVGSINADLVAATVELTDVKLTTDSEGYRRLVAAKHLPDDVYELNCPKISFAGLGPGDLIRAKNVVIQSIVVESPQMMLHHRKQPYNRAKRLAERHQTMYDRLRPLLHTLQIDSVEVKSGSYADIDGDMGNKRQDFRNISIRAGDILMDSTTAGDSTRFFFAKSFGLKTSGYSVPLGNDDYDFGIGEIALDAGTHALVLKSLTLKPRGGREAFTRRQKTQTEAYDIRVPQITLKGFDWWAALHSEALVVEEATVTNAEILIYLDLRLPQSGRMKADNFPQQMLQEFGVPVSIRKIVAEGGRLAYEEVSSMSPEKGLLSFEKFAATAENLTNLPAEVVARPLATFTGSCLLMGRTSMKGKLGFRLSRQARGAFTMDLSVGALNAATINTFAEPMGMVTFTSGTMETGECHLKGDNFRITGTVTGRYSDLKLAPLKVGKDDSYKKRPLLQFLANKLFVKNNNPGANGRLRTGKIDRIRVDEGNFFNFTWLAMKDGLLDLVGVPERFGG